jgi:hypothetical protein
MIKHAIPAIHSPLWSLDVGDVRCCPINRNIYVCIVLIQFNFIMLTALLDTNYTILQHRKIFNLQLVWISVISSHSVIGSL